MTTRRIGEVKPTPKERFVRSYPGHWRTERQIGDLIPCGCGASTLPGVVLDPFFGTGTVAMVAREHHRDWIEIELNPDYIELARVRLGLNQAGAG